MSQPRDRVRHHLGRLRSAAAFVATVSTLPSVVACDPAPVPHIIPLVEPSTGQLEPQGGVLAVTLAAPARWRIVSVDVSRGGRLLELRGNLARVELAGAENVALFVNYVDDGGRTRYAAFEARSMGAAPGSSVSVSQVPLYNRD